MSVSPDRRKAQEIQARIFAGLTDAQKDEVFFNSFRSRETFYGPSEPGDVHVIMNIENLDCASPCVARNNASPSRPSVRNRTGTSLCVAMPRNGG